ncbi:RTA1-domain-containing protein [Lophiostoma macrostomum CBS 122681]|uniref:RTA1-domain-containing protein n=1 Tax=Lophiostoma macrostomum CBS 122681 TaxID=1314788 RepID=A0A6A6SUZ9_9PLEO|nr:RTA1-domain-containing protein [Lophiostoma macrostomum CBS 122681]
MDFHAVLARGLDKNGIDPDNINVSSTDPVYAAMARKYCMLGKCPIEWATMNYRPTVAGNTIYLLCFGALLGVQMYYGIRKKTWTYFVPVSLGIFGEIIGYIGRILLHGNPFIMNYFLLNLIPLTLAPALLTAGLYLCLGRVIFAVGSKHSVLRPKLYTVVFVGFDLLSLVLQAIGGGIAATARDNKGSKLGTHIMIAGLIAQVVSMTIFFAVWGDFVIRVRRAKLSGSQASSQPPLFKSLLSTRTFKLFQWSLFVASILIYVRCLYRVAELWDGFSGHLANEEATFMIFEGPMIILAVTAMTIFHPGRVFGDLWAPAGQGIRYDKVNAGSSAHKDELKGLQADTTYSGV